MNRLLLLTMLVAVATVTTSRAASDKPGPAPSTALAGVAATPLVKVSDAGKIDPKWKSTICDLTKTDCATKCPSGLDWNFNLYRAKGDPSDQFYALLPGPVIAHLQLANGKRWTQLDSWSFTDYEPSEKVTGDGAAPLCMEIFPALYPVAPNRQAVAIALPWQESYSGGGGHWALADFVEIKQGGSSERVISALPFSCDKSIRACFDERDYKASDHCSEDSDGHLTLKWAQSDSAAYDWIATWHETLWPGQEPKSKTEKTQHSEVLSVARQSDASREALMNAIKFCEPTSYCGPKGCDGDK